MAIYRLSSSEGIYLPVDQISEEFKNSGSQMRGRLATIDMVEKIIHDYDRWVRELEEGEYDITPKNANAYNYNLFVRQNGTGLLRMIPRFPGSESAVHDEKNTGEYKPGGRLINIPEDAWYATVANNPTADGKISFFELIFWGQN